MGSTSRAEPLILLQRQPAGQLVSTFQLLPVWEDTDGCCRRLKMFPFMLFSSPPIKPPPKKRKYRNSALGRPCSACVVFKKRSVFSEWPSERRGSNDMRVTAVLFIRPHNRPLSPQPWKFLLPSRRESGARQTMIIVLQRRRSGGQSRAGDARRQLCLAKNA